MIRRLPVKLTTVEEDFRRIGLLPQLSEVDDPTVPREVASPDPSTLAGLDDSEGTSDAKSQAAKQPKPALGPDEDDSDALDPIEDGGSKGAQKGGSGGYKAVAGGKEASLRGESKGFKGLKKKTGYKTIKETPLKDKKQGETVRVASGLKAAPKTTVVGKTMHKNHSMKIESTGTLGRAAALIEEVEQLLHGVQVDEQVDSLLRGFRLVSEDAALLADRLTEMSAVYQVENLVSEMEELSRDAAEAIGIIESGVSDAVSNSEKSDYEAVDEMDETEEETDSEKPYSLEPAKVEQVFGAMVSRLMDALESYDYALDEMGGECGDEHDRHHASSDDDQDDRDAEHGDDDDQEEGLGDLAMDALKAPFKAAADIVSDKDGEEDDAEGGHGEPDGDECGAAHGHDDDGHGDDDHDGQDDQDGQDGDDHGDGGHDIHSKMAMLRKMSGRHGGDDGEEGKRAMPFRGRDEACEGEDC